MPVKSVKEYESEIERRLSGCPSRAQWMYQQMRKWLVDNFPSQAPSAASGRIPDDVPGVIAERESGSVPSLLSRLVDAGLLVKRPVGYDLPQAARILEIRARDARRQARRRQGVTSHPQQGVTSHPMSHPLTGDPLKTPGNPQGQGVTSHPASGCDITPQPPPQVSPPITPSSFPTPHTHTAGAGEAEPDTTDPAVGDDLDSRIRRHVGGHHGLNWSPKAHGIARQMAESGGWNGMVQALDEAVAQGAAEPFSYARKIMAGEQAKRRLSSTAKRGLNPAPKPLTQIKVYE